MGAKQEQKKARWTSPTHRMTTYWPDCVPLIEEDELRSVKRGEWIRAVFRDPYVHDAVESALDRAFREEGYLWTTRALARQWNTVMRKLGYVHDADDWR
jgi:hypothetical protein